jgi:hypothetical protein
MVDQFIRIVGGVQRNRIRGLGNTSSLVVRTPTGYRLDPRISISSPSSTSSRAPSFTAADMQEMERRLKAESDARFESMQAQLQAEMQEARRRDIELMQAQMQAQIHELMHRQNTQPPRHSAHASSHPGYYSQRPPVYMPARQSFQHVPTSSAFNSSSFQSSSSFPSDRFSSSDAHGQTSATVAYQPNFGPTNDQIPAFNAVADVNNLRFTDTREIEEFLLNTQHDFPGGGRGGSLGGVQGGNQQGRNYHSH